MRTHYDIGDRLTVTATFTDENGTATDPDEVTAWVLDPSGTLTTYVSPDATLTNPSVGTWAFQMAAALDDDGDWYVRIAGTSGLLAAEEVQIPVSRSPVVDAMP